MLLYKFNAYADLSECRTERSEKTSTKHFLIFVNTVRVAPVAPSREEQRCDENYDGARDKRTPCKRR